MKTKVNGKMKLVGLFSILILFLGCSSDNEPAPVAEPALSVSANQAEVGSDVTLKIEGVNNEDIQTVKWDLGDGTVSDKKTIVHQYSLPGNYTITVNVSLKDSKSWNLKALIEVYYEEVAENQRLSIAASLQIKDHIQICAHRGFWKDAPENSIKAVALAIEKKIDMIELDVRSSKDGELLLMHDATIDRTTNGTGKVSDLNYKDLRTYYLYHNKELTEERVPLFKEVLFAARGKIYIDIDVKISDYKSVYNMVKQYGMLSQVMFTVYSVADAKKMVTFDKVAMVLPVIYTMEDLDNYMAICKPLSVAQFNSKAFVDDILTKAADNKIALFKNIYINIILTTITDNYKQVKEFLSKKGDIIQTDYPVELMEYLKNN